MLYDPNHPEISGYRGEFLFLSNFYFRMAAVCEEFKGVHLSYPTVEHAYQAAKSGRLDTRQAIAYSTTAANAKAAGRSVVLRKDWEAVKDNVMRHWVGMKFAQPELMNRLIATYPAKLVEANNHGDHYWGTDMFGDGLNRLGEIQMELRLELLEYYGYPQH